MGEIVAAFMTGFLIGGLLFKWSTELRWRSNAKDYKRIESGGRLYKVEYAE